MTGSATAKDGKSPREMLKQETGHMKKSFSRRDVLQATLAGAGAMVGGAALAQSFPSKPFKIYVGFTPGGFTDVAARIIGTKLSESLGQSVVIENKPGANGFLASDATAKSPPDGYTLFMSSPGLTTNPLLSEQAKYDPVKGFTPLSLLALIPNVLVVHPGVPAKNMQEFLALARSRKPPLTQSSAGAGSPGHLSGQLLEVMAKIEFEHVPYKGAGGVNDLVGGHVDFSFPTVSTGLPLVRNGKLRAIAVTSAKRSAVMPDVPTIGETVPGYETAGWYGIVGPPGIPKAIADKLTDELIRIMKMPDVREKFAAHAAEPVGSTGAEMAEFLEQDVKRWTGVMKASGLKPAK